MTGQDKGDGTTPGTALLVMIRMIGSEWRMTLVMILVEIVMLLMEIIKGGKLQSLIDVQEFSATFCQNNKMLRRRIVMMMMMMRRRRRRRRVGMKIVLMMMMMMTTMIIYDDHNIFGSDPDLLIWRASVTDGIIASDQRD